MDDKDKDSLKSDSEEKSSKASGSSKKRKERLKKLQEERDQRLATTLDTHSQSKWGWKGGPKLNIDPMSAGVNVDNRKQSTSQFGTAPIHATDYSILHKRSGKDQRQSEDETKPEEKSSVKFDGKVTNEKTTEAWHWERENTEGQEMDEKKKVSKDETEKEEERSTVVEEGDEQKRNSELPSKKHSADSDKGSTESRKSASIIKDEKEKGQSKPSVGVVKFDVPQSKTDYKQPPTVSQPSKTPDPPLPAPSQPKTPPPAPSQPKAPPPAPSQPKAPPPAPSQPKAQPPAPSKPKAQPPAPSKPKAQPPAPSKPKAQPPAPSKPKAPPPVPAQPKAPPPQKPSISAKVESPKVQRSTLPAIKAKPQPLKPKALSGPSLPVFQEAPKLKKAAQEVKIIEKSDRKISDSTRALSSVLPSQTLSTNALSESGSSVASSDADQTFREKPRRHKRRKPRPPELNTTDYDMDDELSSNLSDESKISASDNKRLSIFEINKIKHPDDELLFSLTAKEEIIYKRSISEMRWEEEENISSETASYTTGESEAEAAAILWQRIGAGKKFAIPTINVNDRRISLSHLDPEDSKFEDEEFKAEKYKNIFEQTPGIHDGGSDEQVQAVFDLIDEAHEHKRKSRQDEERRASARAKLWRRRLIVVILLNFLMKFRALFVTSCEMFVPMIVCGVVVSGMAWNSDGTMQSLQAKVFDAGAGKDLDPFERIGAESIFTAFCSNEEYCGKKSTRYYFIVYSPSNKFTDDIMKRAITTIGLTEPNIVLATNQDKDKDQLDIGPDEIVSKIIAVNSSAEVERICREHWQKVSKYSEGIQKDGSDLYERKLNRLKAESKLVRYPMGVIFSMEGNLIGDERLKLIKENKAIPKSLTYTVRTFYSEIANTVEGFPFREHLVSESRKRKGKRHFQSTPYLHTGIIGMQMAIDLAFADKIVESAAVSDPFMKIGDTEKISRADFLRRYKQEPSLKQFEYPTYKDSTLRVRGWVALTLSIIFGYLVGDIVVAQNVVQEQNRGCIELLKIHGMTTSMRWIANMVIHGIFRGVTTLVMALVIHYQLAEDAVAEFSSPLFLWLFLWMHAITATCFNYFITSGLGVKKPELAGLIVTCASFLTLLCPLDFFVEGRLHRFTNLFLCFFLPQWNLANGVYYYLRFELYEEGLDWYDFPVLLDTEHHLIISLPLSCNIFLYSTMLYLSLTIYTDHIIPREFSPKESWLFFLKTLTRPSPSETKPTRPIPRSQKPTIYEVGPKMSAYGPRFRNVTTTDSANKSTVLDNISLDIYEGEVTCVVGQIGSGKSDFLNVIAGVNTPSAGFVDVKGLKVHEYHDITNRYVSLCPQKQLLIETLSVEDHIRLCCMLHGVSYAKAKTQATFLLKMFGLMPMRRHSYKGITIADSKKIMLAMALSKSPSVLLLDNPVEQLDSESRFQFWRLLQELKPMRSIVVTCTTLQEAQLYGDRIVILSKGKLVCYGSPMFLRLAYGIGNVMTLRMAEGVEPNIPAIQAMMHLELHGAKTTSLDTKKASVQVDTVKFILPFGKFYGALLEKLEDNMDRFGITKITMGQPSLWAIFHKIANHPGIEQVLAKREIRMLRGGDPNIHEEFERSVETPIPVQKGTPNHGIVHKVHILVHKKIWYYRQKYITFLVAYLPQLILLVLMVYFSRLFLLNEPESLSKVMSTRMYDNNYVLVRSADNEHTREGWQEAFHERIRSDDKKAVIELLDFSDDLEGYLAQGMAHTLTHYKKQTIVAFSRDKKGHIGYYSSNSIHSAPIASHLMMQALLYLISPDRKQPYISSLVTHPFIQYPGFPGGSTQSNSSTILGLFLSLILCLLSAPVLRMILTERSSKFKTLQRMAGVSGPIYWFSHGVADCFLYILITLICWVLVIFVDNVGYLQFNGWEERLYLFIILSCWLCWAALPYTYLLACWIPQHLTGYGHYVLYHFIFGIIPKVVTYQFLRLYVKDFYYFLRFFLYIFPQYSITSACVHFLHVVGDEHWCRNADKTPCEMYQNLTKLLRNQTNGLKDVYEKNVNVSVTQMSVDYLSDKISFDDEFRTCCRAYCEEAGTCHADTASFAWDSNTDTVIPNLQHDIVALIYNGFIYWALILLYEHRLIQSLGSLIVAKVCGNLEHTVAQRDTKTSDEPEDVKQEHQKVDYMVEIEGDVDSEVYLVQDVTKFYKYVKGLDHIYFSVPINTVTGLLGLPKSGKTTLIDILTCQLSSSSGYVYKDNDLLEGANKRKLMMGVGYCPQKPSMLSYLTGIQMLTVMGRLRGLSRSECEQHVLWWLQLFELQDVGNKKCSAYRKGQQQRLGCALTLIGDTNMIILDEPTANMDKLERYTFWNIINRLPNYTNRTVLFTTIDADVVQKQSSKALLLESGSLVAVGHLTEIFKNNNQGMTLSIRYGVSAMKKLTEYQKKTKIDKLKDHVIQYLSPCALIDEQENLLVYHLKDQNLKLSRVYSVMEGAKVRFTSILEHFQVHEPSLSDVILQFHKARVKRLEKMAAAEDKDSIVGAAR